jgi:hypothetical protein
MKPIAAIILYIFTINTTAIFAQHSPFTYGIQVGANVGSVLPKGKIDPNSSGKIIVGPNIGIYGSYAFAKHWAVSLATTYSYKGADFFQATYSDTMLFDIPQLNLYDFPAPYISLNIKGYMKQHYVEIPLHIHYMPNNKISMFAGLQAAYLLKGESKSTQDIYVGTSIDYPFLTYLDSLIDISNQYKKWDWAVSAGGAISIAKQWQLGIRGSYSLSSIYKKDLLQLKKDFVNLFATISITYALKPKQAKPISQ